MAAQRFRPARYCINIDKGMVRSKFHDILDFQFYALFPARSIQNIIINHVVKRKIVWDDVV